MNESFILQHKEHLMRYFKPFILIMLLFLVGCTKPGKNNIFSKESDSLLKSPCASCQKEPFYVNGKWVN